MIAALLRLSGLAWSLTDPVTAPHTVLGLAAIAVTGLVVLLASRSAAARRAGGSAPTLVRALSLRRRASRTGRMRLRDPGAAGRPRPRAPSAAATAA
ncbi:hypothetical protein HKK72_18260 [Actinomadura sp. HBU206391]|nr:hypothetical protein [Actinomadura sp. HBU206391]